MKKSSQRAAGNFLYLHAQQRKKVQIAMNTHLNQIVKKQYVKKIMKNK